MKSQTQLNMVIGLALSLGLSELQLEPIFKGFVLLKHLESCYFILSQITCYFILEVKHFLCSSSS